MRIRFMICGDYVNAAHCLINTRMKHKSMRNLVRKMRGPIVYAGIEGSYETQTRLDDAMRYKIAYAGLLIQYLKASPVCH